MIRELFDTYGAPVLLVLFFLFFLFESRSGLRKRVQSRWKRLVINFILSIPAFLLLRLLFIPAMVWLAMANQEWQIGLSFWLPGNEWVRGVIIFFLLDYGNYIWHILLHKLPLMWRFHLVHHSDLDLDITTAFRFHFGELAGSIIFRGLIILLLGASPWMVLIYEIVFEAATQFHHSNIRLSERVEKWLNYLIVTPRMHGFHHSMKKNETDSNYSIIFSFWDRLHRTFSRHISRPQPVIGVPSYADPDELTIGYLLKLPFRKIRPWKKWEE